MQTVADGLRGAAASLAEGVAALLGPDVLLRDISVGSSLISLGPNHAFEELPLEKRRLQSRLRDDNAHFWALAQALLRAQSDESRRHLDHQEKAVREVIEQEHVHHRSTGRALTAVKEALREVTEAIAGLHDPAEGGTLLVPDTNALIASPTLQKWTFNDIAEFEILLCPPVLAELDEHKINHRNPNVRKKAQSIIRQIKEYRRRGPLHAGVNVVAGRVRLRSFAVELRPEDVLFWLSSDSEDDRILAYCIDAMRAHTRSKVALVTADINLQNKAELARVSFLEPPSETK